MLTATGGGGTQASNEGEGEEISRSPPIPPKLKCSVHLYPTDIYYGKGYDGNELILHKLVYQSI